MTETMQLHEAGAIVGFRLSPQQRDLWRASKEGSALAESECRIGLAGDLQSSRLYRALERVVQRHEALRTTFRTPGWSKLPLQVIAEEAAFDWREIDGAGIEPLPGLRLETGPPLQAVLARRSAGDHLLLLRLPALCADARSLDNLAAELACAYEALGGGPDLLEDQLQYCQYSEWQNGLGEEATGEEREFWRQRQGSAGPPPAALRESAEASGELVLPADLGALLERLAGSLGIALSTLVLGAWQLLLWKASEGREVEVRRLFDGRKFQELTGAVGLFARCLPVRASLRPAQAVDDFLAQLEREQEQVSLHQELFPGDAEEPGGTAVLFEEVTPGGSHSAGGVRFSVLSRRCSLVPGALRLSVTQSDRGLLLALSGAGTPWLERLATVLSEIAARPRLTVGEVQVTAPEERRRLLHDWQGALRPRDGVTLPGLFAARVAAAPEALAVVCGERALTFAGLDQRAGQLAACLQARGIGPESRVAVVLRRSPDMAVAVLGILQAGAAFVPLDPGQPPKRLEAMLGDAGVRVAVTEEELLALLPDSVQAVCLDRDGEEIGRAGRGAAAAPAPEGAAYMIFTSGSTGRPKGVLVSHRSAVNLIATLGEVVYAGAEPPLRISLNAPLAFDGAIKQLLQIFAGHTLVIVPEEVRRDSEALRAWIEEQALDGFDCTPAQLKMLLAAGLGTAEAGAPGRVLVGGEALDERVWQRLVASRGIRFWNLYGPTECTVDATACEVAVHPDRPTLGRPLPNVRVYVLDAGLHLAPVGVWGEICIAGAGVARGYDGRPDLTAERFVPDPFCGEAGEPGGRAYRTGDLGRRLADGRLEYAGRRDLQVKIRGVRVELEEIESALQLHCEVKEAAVALESAGSGEPALVAYWVPARPDGAAARELQGFLRERLPEYMVPASFVPLRRMPLTRNGKIDRTALASAERIAVASEWPVAAPRTPFEELLLPIWADLLPVPAIGVDDNFFDLGGHSLLATRLVSRVREALHVELPLRALFEQPTIAGLARAVQRAVESESAAAPPPIVRIPRDGELPLSFAQQRLWAVDQIEGSTAYNIPTTVRLLGKADVPALEQALSGIVRRHEVLRTTFPAEAGRARLRIAPPGPWPLPVVDLSGLGAAGREAESARLAGEEAARRFDLARGPLLRTTLLRLGEREHLGLFTLHHIASDGWSSSILVRELTTLYRAAVEGKPSPLPELPVQYADFAAWQRQVLQGEALEPLLGFWREQLAGLPPRLELPADRPRSGRLSLRGAMRTHALPAELVKGLRDLGRSQNATLFMVLLAGLELLLYRLTRQQDFLVGTDMAGRSRGETEPLIGFFINLLLLRARMGGNPTFVELLRQVRETSLAAYAHQDLPFEKLVDELRPERGAGGTSSLIQVLFVMQNTPRQELSLPGLELAPYEVESRTAKFELALFVTESPQGLGLTWNYSTDLFDAETVDRMNARFAQLLGDAVREPEARIESLRAARDEERKEQTMQRGGRKEARLKQLMTSTPSRPEPETEELVHFSLEPGTTLPLVVRSAVDELDVADWAAAHRELIDRKLLAHGALLFRGFDVRSPADFERFAGAVCPGLFSEYGDLPREGSSQRVYHSTPYPADKWILFHNESSHMHRWPLKQFFYCVQAASEGGETPLVDCREAYRRLDPGIRERLRDKNVLYVRNFVQGFDVSWQDFFRTEDRAAVEKYCREAGIELQWKDGDGLRTKQLCPAVTRHPRTGEDIFFNQLQLHHVACLEPETRASVTSLFAPEDLPRSVCYGDGTPIEDSVMEEIGRVYDEAAVSLPWENGDVIMVDNMLVAHARKPFSGPRKIVVAMGELVYRHELADGPVALGA